MISIASDKAKTPENQPLHTTEVAALRLLGTLVAQAPEALQTLLEDYETGLPTAPTATELTDATLTAIEQSGPPFHRRLARLLLDQVVAEDAYSEGGGGGVTVGADPVSAIAGAVGSIFNVAGGLLGKKERKRAARRESMRSTMNYFQQREADQRQARLAVHAQTQRSKTIETVGILLLVALLGGLFIWRMRKIQTPNTQDLNPKTP